MKPNIGENIKKLRAENQVTQEQLAEHLCISYQAVSKWENNVTTPDIFLLPAIAEYFEVPIDELFKVNMNGYRNRAARLFAIYEQTGKKEDFEKADAEYEKLFAENNAYSEDMRIYGILNQYRSDALAKKAEELLRKSIELGHETADAQLMNLLASRGRNQENIDKCEEIIQTNPDNARNWILLSISYERSKMFEKALETVQKGLKKFPDDSGLLCTFGNLLSNSKRYDEAFDCWNKSVEQNPDMCSSYYSMAFAYTELKKHKEAIWAWEQVIAFLERQGLFEEMAWPKREIAKLRELLGQQ